MTRRSSDSGPYRLTIERVDTLKLYGHVDTIGGAGQHGAPLTFRIVGALQGNHVIYGPASNKVNLEVDGSTMRGTWSGRVHRDLSLTKKP